MTRSKRKVSYRSKAYRAYRTRLAHKHFGANAPKMLGTNDLSMWILGEAMADSLYYLSNRTGFMRRFLTNDVEKANQKADEEKRKAEIEARLKERQKLMNAFKAELLPYSRHYDYNSRCKLETT